MAIDTISPVADSQLDPGDSFSFRVDDTYTSITVEVETAGGWEYAYDSSLSGAQAGYTVAVTIPTAGRHLFTVTRTAGWNLSPFSIRVVENETGSDATTTTNYTLYSANDYPQTSDPYFLQSIGDSFLAHYDTPSSYAGKVGYYPRVKATADGLEFVDTQALIDARGDVFGPASALDNAIARYDLTTGKLLQSSLATIDDTGKLLLVSGLSLNNTDVEGLRKAQFQEGAGVSTPASGFVYLYAKTDGKLYIKDDTGTETDLTSGGGGGGSGDVVGPASATNDSLAQFDGTTGKLIKSPSALTYNGGTLQLAGTTSNITIREHSSAPGTPASGYVAVYAKADGKLYIKDDVGTETDLTGGGASDHGALTGLADDDHTQYVLGAGTRAQDAALLTERADHVNTPAAGKAELWLRNDTRQVPMFTDDQGTDYELVKSNNPGGNVNDSLAIWQNLGGDYYLADITALTYTGGALKFASANANIQLSERSTAPSAPAGDGAFWVRNDAPNTPMFTDDAGNDFALNKPTVYNTIMGKMGGPTTTNWYTSILGSSFDNDVDWDDIVGANSSSDPVTDYVDYIDGSIFTAPFAGNITNIRLSVRPLVAQDWTFIAFRQQWSGAAGTFTEIDNTGNVSISAGWNDFDMTPASLTTLAKGDSIGLLWTISDAAPSASDLSARIYVTFEAS